MRNPRFRLWSAAAQPDGFPDRIVERYGYTGESAVRAVERGAADITADGLDSDVASRRSRPRCGRATRAASTTPPSPARPRVWLNTRLPPFDDVRVRRALNYAVDRNHLIELAGGPDVAQVGCQVLPPNTDGYRRYCPYTLHPDPAGTYNGPDLAKARRLVAASGTKGQPVTVWFYDIPIGRRNGAYFVSVLREPRLQGAAEDVPHLGSTWRPNRQAGVGGWAADYPSANNFFSPTFTCRSYDPARPNANFNVAAFCNRRIDAEIARARALQTSDPPAASRLWSDDRPPDHRPGPLGRDPHGHRARLRLPPDRQLHLLLPVGRHRLDRRLPRPALGALRSGHRAVELSMPVAWSRVAAEQVFPSRTPRDITVTSPPRRLYSLVRKRDWPGPRNGPMRV